ncbi:MAG: hypothetical protein ACREX7_05300 [Casimicrobiaceae bacterium]
MAASPPRAAPAPSWPPRLALLLLALAYALPFAAANLTADTARDLAAAQRILGGELPTHGPIINSALYLGPVWYYLLALGMAASGSITGTSLFVGFLAAAKFPLAYGTGRELVDARFGWFTALAVALPGPGMLQAVTWTNPVLVEAAAWLFLFACCRSWRRASDAWLIVAGLSLGLAIHAHPTCLLLAPALAGVVAARVHAGNAPRAAALAAAALLLALPFLPAAVEPSSRVGEVGQLSVAIAEASRHWRWTDLLAIPWNMFAGAPGMAAGTFLYRTGTAGPLWHAALTALWMVIAAGAITLAAQKRLARIAICAGLAFMLGVAIVAALRSFTPYYMTFVLLPAAALGVGAALTALDQRGRAGRAATMCAAALIVAIELALAGGQLERAGESWLRTALVNVSDFKAAAQAVKEEPLYPAWTRDAVARALCASARPVALHGMLATGVDIDFAIETWLACGRRDRAVLAGTDPAAEHWIGLPAYAWRRLGLVPARRMGSYGVDRPGRIIAPVAAHAIVTGREFPPRHVADAPQHGLALRFRAPGNAALVVTDIVPWYMPLRALAVTRAGAALAPTIASSSLVAFRCRDCDAREVEWTLNLQAADPAWVDIVTLLGSRGSETGQ